ALLVFIVTNKVFSPQYVVWLLPFAPLLPRRHTAVAGAIIALTIVIFPYDYGSLLAFQPAPVILLNLRNSMVVAWLVALITPQVRDVLVKGRASASSPAAP